MRIGLDRYGLFLFLFCISIFPIDKVFAQAKIYTNPHLNAKVNKAIDHIYNLEFDQSEPIIRELENELGEHSGVYLLKAFDIYWKKKPFKYGSKEFDLFENYLKKAQSIAEGYLEEDEDDIESSFFALSSHAYLAQLYVDNGENLQALSEAKTCYSYIKDGFDLVDKYPEFYFPCGIYNYYREKYPEENPFFKPFLWFFRSGDKAEGIRMLKIGAQKAVFTKVESNTYLFHIYLRYEGKPKQALPFAKKLFDDYPNNITFTANYIESLIFDKQLGKARPLIDTLLNNEATYYQYIGYLFLGNYLEKVDKKYFAALNAYKKANVIGEKLEIRSPHMDSQIYCGMGRVYLKQDNKELAENYFKRTIKRAEYSIIKDEAKSYLEAL